MKTKFAALAAMMMTFLVSSAYAHNAQVIGNYKVEVGWKNEPPIVGKENAIEIIVTKATPADKKSSSGHQYMGHDKKETKLKDMVPADKKSTPKKIMSQKANSVVFIAADDNMKNMAKEKTMTKKDTKHTHKEATKSTKRVGISGLDKTLEVSVTLGGKKTFLKLAEDPKKKGTYYGDYVPHVAGFPIVHISGKILKTPIDMDFHPEKVQAAK